MGRYLVFGTGPRLSGHKLRETRRGVPGMAPELAERIAADREFL